MGTKYEDTGSDDKVRRRFDCEESREPSWRCKRCLFFPTTFCRRMFSKIHQVYNRFAQRDNITTQKISEATNRDSAAMKSLAVLGAVFFPGTFVAVSCSTSKLNRERVITDRAS